MLWRISRRGGFSLGGRGREGIAKRIARGEEGGGSPDLWERRLFVPNYFLSICPGCVRWTDRPRPPPTDRPFQGGAKQSHLVTDPPSLPPFTQAARSDLHYCWRKKGGEEISGRYSSLPSKKDRSQRHTEANCELAGTSGGVAVVRRRKRQRG